MLNRFVYSRFFTLLVLIYFSALTVAAAEENNYELMVSESQIRFTVDSTFHEVHGTATAESCSVRFDNTAGTLLSPLILTIPVQSMNTENKMRDFNMRNMFKQNQYPSIRVQADALSCSRNSPAEFDCTARGTIEMRGTIRPLQFPVQLKRHNGQMQASGKVELNRKDFDLNPPGIPGLVKVNKRVLIEFDTVWKNS